MAKQEGQSQTLRCPSCGVVLPPDGGEQYFCEVCGSALPGEVQDARVAPGGLELRDWRKEAAQLPDWLQEASGAEGEEAPRPARGIELRPATVPSAGREAPRGGGSAGSNAFLVVAILLGLLCLGIGILVVVLLS
jgi:predicted RNA-binding Zn-ribbon protein involved in translation (DUF1610 family)